MYKVQVIIWRENVRFIDKKFTKLSVAASWLRRFVNLAKNITSEEYEGVTYKHRYENEKQ